MTSIADPTRRALVRPYRPEDRDALFDICVRTAENGGDSRDLYPDHELLPNIFAAPYAELEPDLAFVVDDGTRAVGYVVGTADTAEFVRRFREEWLPRLADRYPAPAWMNDPGRAPRTPTEVMLRLMHTPERMLLPELADYPAHLHIDLLPSHQRAGYGRELMQALFSALVGKGVPRVHLGMVTANTPARAFYDRLGFHVIPVPDPGPLTYLGRATV
ncbi:GNAT family N-acetyltransferase [Streptacidiphilus monticola]|jgi:GNAT superfamily N-acetyltransferase|uniref:GNAT family N-acetyltransferase n=1 Tax=Streptacidiphilus monticola TaxID=2161674 RepID=A0ABW1G0G0_9ACTN